MNKTPVQQQLEESLSALVDGEATELELRRLLKADDEQYAELRQRWVTYQTASASIKKDLPAVDYVNLADSIMDAIADEAIPVAEQSVASSTVQAAANDKKFNIWSGVGRFAVAASVAGAVVMGVQFIPGQQDNQVVDVAPVAAPSNGPSSAASFGQGVPNDAAVSTVSSDSVVNSTQEKPTIVINENTKQQLKDAEEQVQRLMLEHAQNAAQNTQQGVLPYARVPEDK